MGQPPAFKWEDYLEFARQQLASNDEAALRSVVSRAYYAAFHAARAVASVRYRYSEQKDTVEGGHTALWLFLRDPKKVENPLHRGMGAKGQSFRLDRNKADYNASAELNWKFKAIAACKTAEEIIANLRR